jgi:hypothetical protein
MSEIVQSSADQHFPISTEFRLCRHPPTHSLNTLDFACIIPMNPAMYSDDDPDLVTSVSNALK